MPRSTPPQPAAPEPEAPAAAITAAALTITDTNLPRRLKASEPWQTECWEMYDCTGQLRYATSWYSNALSRGRLYPVQRKADGTLEPVTSGPAWEAMEELWTKSAGMGEMLRVMAQNDFVAGDMWLVGRTVKAGEATDERLIGTEVWEVASVEELTKSAGSWTLDYGDGEKIILDDGDTVIRLWTPSPRRRWLADSPVKAALQPLREIRLLSQHINAQVYSRLLGAGLLLVPSEMTFAKPTNGTLPDVNSSDASAFLAVLGQTMMEAVKDPGSTSAFVPIVVKAPGEHIDKVKHLTFWSQLDEKAPAMRKDAVTDLAITLDMPPEVLTGTAQVNHWGSWQIDETAIKSHIEPGLSRLAAAITVGYLWPIIKDPTILLAYDSSALRMRPNRSKEALELYDRGQLSEKALLRETGFEESDRMDDEEYKTWVLRKVATGSATPEMVVAAIAELIGITLPTETDNNRQTRPDPSLVDHPTNDPPEPPDSETASLMATCEAMVYRALERAGNRIKNRTTAKPACAADAVYLFVPQKTEHLAVLLSGAWEPLPTLLARTRFSAAKVQAALDSYVRTLITTQTPYDTATMERHVYAALED